MNRILIFEKLNLFNLIIIIFFKLFFKKIYYRELSSVFKNDFYVKLLNKIGVLCLGFQSLDNKYFNRSFNIRRKLELNLANEYVEKNFFFTSFIEEHNPNIEKFKLCTEGLLELG